MAGAVVKLLNNVDPTLLFSSTTSLLLFRRTQSKHRQKSDSRCRKTIHFITPGWGCGNSTLIRPGCGTGPLSLPPCSEWENPKDIPCFGTKNVNHICFSLYCILLYSIVLSIFELYLFYQMILGQRPDCQKRILFWSKGYFSLNDFYAWAACKGQNSKD